MHTRRIIAVGLAILAVILMLVAPESWGGLALLGLAVLIEIIGIAIEHRSKGQS